MGNRPNVYKHDCPNSHECQQAGRMEGHLIRLCTSTFQKIYMIFANKAWETLTEGKRQFPLACPFLSAVGTAGGSNGLGRLVPHGLGDMWGWGGWGGPPSCCLISLQPAETQSLPDPEPVALRQTEVPGAPGLCLCRIPQVQGCPRSCCRVQAVIPARHRAVLPAAHGLSCNCNACLRDAVSKPGWNLAKGRVCFGQLRSKSGIPSFLKIWQRREWSPAEQMEMTTPIAMGWGCNPAALKQNLSFFVSVSLWMQKPQVLNIHGPDYSCSKHKIKWQRGSKSWQIPISIVISFLAVSGAFYHSQASQKSNSYLKD